MSSCASNGQTGAIRGNVALARGDLPAGHLALTSLELIGKASARARDLVNQIRAFGPSNPQVLAHQPLRPRTCGRTAGRSSRCWSTGAPTPGM
jgi:hypothetical protein